MLLGAGSFWAGSARRCRRWASGQATRSNGLEQWTWRPRSARLARGDEEELMRLDDVPESENIEDRRGDSGGSSSGGGFGLPIGGGGLGIGAMLILGVIGYALGIDPR